MLKTNCTIAILIFHTVGFFLHFYKAIYSLADLVTTFIGIAYTYLLIKVRSPQYINTFYPKLLLVFAALPVVGLACFFKSKLLFKNLVFLVLYPEEDSITETSVKQLLTGSKF